MEAETQPEEREWHLKFAKELFNHTWTLIEKAERTRDEDEEMVNAAHASRYHWGIAGEPVNFARGEWQLSRVYSLLRRPEQALHHAQRSLEICQENGIGDFDLAFAYEALARASRVAGKEAERQRYLELARQAGEQIKEGEDRRTFLADLATA